MAWFEQPRPKLGTEGDVIPRRVGAILIDLILLGVVTSAFSGVLGRVGLATVASFVGLLLSFGYYIYLEGEYGQTIGKMALGLAVVTEDGDQIGYGEAAIRTVVRIVDVLPILYLLGFIVMLVTDRKQRIGDIAANTVVVRTG